jgi:hypothetical protein
MLVIFVDKNLEFIWVLVYDFGPIFYLIKIIGRRR